MNYKRKNEIEILSNKFRRTVGIDSIGISNIFDVCSSEFYLIRYPIGEKAILGAALIMDNDKIVFSNSSCILSREIFTVAHEIGHMVLGHVNNENRIIHDINIDNTTEEEQEANYFAVCFLMPSDKVDELIKTQFHYKSDYNFTTLEIATIMGIFNVSFEVALNRLNQLGFVSDMQRLLLIQQKNEEKVSNLLRVIGSSPELCFPSNIKRLPVDFLKWTASNYQNGVIPQETMEKAVLYLDGVSLEDFSITPPKEEDSFDLDAFLEEDDE